MGKADDRADVERLKKLLTEGWKLILSTFPDEQVYGFGISTNDCGKYMYPFVLGEKGLAQAAAKHAAKGIYTEDVAAEKLRWSTGVSPYAQELIKNAYLFEGRPDIYGLSPTALAREVHYRLKVGCTALKELDAESFFGAGPQRECITLYIQGGDVNREWILKWAKKLNPPIVYERFAKIGAPQGTVGAFTEFGTKKVYETERYAQSADKKLIAAATQYHLFLFDTTGPKQLLAKALPSKEDYCSLGGVAMSGDGELIAARPFGGGRHGKEFFILRRSKGWDVTTVQLKQSPMAVAVSPSGDWIAVTDESGALNIFETTGVLRISRAGHAHWPRGIAVTSDGGKLVTGDSRSVILWNTADWLKAWKIELMIDSLDFHPSGQVIIGSCRYARRRTAEPKSASIIDAHTGKVIRELTVDGYRIGHVRFSPDGRHVACAMRADCEGYSGTNVCALVEFESGRVVDWLKSNFEQVRDFAFLPHRCEIAVAVFGHTRRPLVLWKCDTLQP